MAVLSIGVAMALTLFTRWLFKPSYERKDMKEILYIIVVGLCAFPLVFWNVENEFIKFVACVLIFIAGLSVGFKYFPQLFSSF